jgi:hypothetical protein
MLSGGKWLQFTPTTKNNANGCDIKDRICIVISLNVDLDQLRDQKSV